MAVRCMGPEQSQLPLAWHAVYSPASATFRWLVPVQPCLLGCVMGEAVVSIVHPVCMATPRGLGAESAGMAGHRLRMAHVSAFTMAACPGRWTGCHPRPSKCCYTEAWSNRPSLCSSAVLNVCHGLHDGKVQGAAVAVAGSFACNHIFLGNPCIIAKVADLEYLYIISAVRVCYTHSASLCKLSTLTRHTTVDVPLYVCVCGSSQVLDMTAPSASCAGKCW